MPVERSLKHARESRMPSFGGLLPVTEISGSRGALLTNVIVYSFKGYDTPKHSHILRPAKATRQEHALAFVRAIEYRLGPAEESGT